MTDEQKKKLSESLKGKKTWNKGIPMTDEQKKKISDSHKGKTPSEETRRKISDSHKGKPATIKGRHRVYNPDGTYRMIKDPDPISPLW